MRRLYATALCVAAMASLAFGATASFASAATSMATTHDLTDVAHGAKVRAGGDYLTIVITAPAADKLEQFILPERDDNQLLHRTPPLSWACKPMPSRWRAAAITTTAYRLLC